ncbi:DUF4296 domain-containing protein [Tamlana sp. s12]|uniref:DUF4296 domain-containing protein n=1 Tax=Tamlana sp. s12 TaxID=1630406 RepID=UPI000801031A|nr:DUF4296 domain-containing protein [Tamlana sp. s12]OBQ57290.1 hypothetical protein VQ01_02105 [Tamlana sp. s12]QQY82519.1 DUF4296 domain-containing protein [Tamlana sp. s12]
MILKRVILCLGMLLSFACNRFKGPEKPENLIPEDKMVNILIDSKLLTSTNSANKRIMKDSNLDVNTYVYRKYKIDSTQFADSNAYYAFHVEIYDDIYNKAIDSLERLHEELKTLQADEWKAQTKKEEEASLKGEAERDSLKLVKPIIMD